MTEWGKISEIYQIRQKVILFLENQLTEQPTYRNYGSYQNNNLNNYNIVCCDENEVSSVLIFAWHATLYK
jgi:hypothetical protein